MNYLVPGENWREIEGDGIICGLFQVVNFNPAASCRTLFSILSNFQNKHRFAFLISRIKPNYFFPLFFYILNVKT